MNDINEYFPYVRLITVLMSSILAVVLASTARSLIGRGWLVAFAVITLVTWPSYSIIPLIAQTSSSPSQIYYWFDVMSLLDLFAMPCFGLFLFSNWSRTRIKLDVKDLLLSFSGRIPRSAFWISVCILFPLGAKLGFAPFRTEADGLPKTIIWIVYAGWCIPSIWFCLAVYTKRWHDCSKSGWMSLILLIPIIGVFWFFGYLGFVRGTQGPNPYGDDLLDTHTV